VAIEWEMELKGLTQAECSAIESLFDAVEGRLRTFTFLDPFDNLLRWSENPTAESWSVTSPEPGEVLIEQAVAAPAWFEYCLSVSARGGPVRLFARSGSRQASATFTVGPEWQRVEFPLSLGGTEEAISFGAAIPDSGAVEVTAFQLEPQRAASRYKKTTSQAGIHPAARFLDDVLEVTADGPENHSLVVRIRSPLD
jgi:hypothetical protein